MTQRFYLSLFIIIALSLSACKPASSPINVRPDNTAEIAAQTAEQSGDYMAASQQYLDLASIAKEPQKSAYFLHAAMLFWQLNQLESLTSTLANIDRTVLNPKQQLEIAILDANLALINVQPEQALAVLFPIDLSYTSPAQKKQALELKIQAYNLTENWLEKANNHILLAPLLSEMEQAENQQSLWQALMLLTPQALDLFNPGIPPAIDSGWFSLAYLVQTYRVQPETFIVALEDWQRNYPKHPAEPSLYQQSLDAGTKLPQDLNDIAILLPETGPYKAAAQAIKRGIIAAHLTSKSNSRLHFFAVDTDKRTGLSNVLQQYQRAIDRNVNIVIGPLDKESLEILANADNLSIPVIALNRLENENHKKNIFQFGLAPEDEAVAVANYAIEKDYRRALVLAPDSPWGARIAAAFNTQWSNNGGVLLRQANYDDSQHDFAKTLKPLLGIEASERRHQLLKQHLGYSLEFESRRRQDADFIFLVAKPLKARQLVPQLKFHRSGRLPVIATSHVYEGFDNSQQNIDLNKLVISDIPWVFNDLSQSDPIYIALNSASDKIFERRVRLYALGADAYNLIPELNQLSRSPEASIEGATGDLSINPIGQIIRTPKWAQFNNGLIELLPAESSTTSQQ
jgi:outer membrane PBP1 activator LpoA protein